MNEHVRNFIVVLTRHCQLTCRYCFELEKLGTHARCGTGPLSYATAIRQLKQLGDCAKVDFYGGEPLLEQKTIGRIIDWALRHRRKFLFSLSTNGQRIPDDTFADRYLNSLDTIYLSIDGPEVVSDLNRGRGALGKALAFITWLRERGYHKYMARSTFTKQNIPHLLETAQWFYALVRQKLLPAHSFRFNMADFDLWRQADFRNFEKAMRQILSWYSYLPRSSKRTFHIQGLDKTSQKETGFERFFSVCSAGNSTFALSPEGDLFPCVTELFFPASMRHKPLPDTRMPNEYQKFTMLNDYKRCHNCEKYECGPCPALFKMVTGDYRTIPEKFCKLGRLKNRIITEYVNAA